MFFIKASLRIMKISENVKFAAIFVAIFSTVLIVIGCFFELVRSEIISLAVERTTLVAENSTNNISRWADRILNELNIYQEIVQKEGSVMNEHTCEILSTSLFAHSEYPYGLYWADKENHLHMTSGWHEESYVPTQRSWYLEGLGHIRFEFGEPYVDEFTGEACVSATARMRNGAVEGVLATDVYLSYLSEVVNQVTEQEIENAFIVTKKSRVIVADSDISMNLQILGESGTALYQEINGLLDHHFLGQTTIHADGDDYCVNINRIENTDWLFVTCMNQDMLAEKLRVAELTMFFIGFSVCTTLSLLTIFSSRKMRASEQLAKTDPLTGLLNRDGLRNIARQLLIEKPDQGVLLVMDMDNFKKINDQFGHPEGDKVLREFAGLLTEYFNRNRDYAARLGGDEFAVFVGRPIERENLALMLDKFMELFHKKYDEKYSSAQLSVSIGAAYAVGNYKELYRRADGALYAAKQSGKNRYAFEEVSEKEE